MISQTYVEVLLKLTEDNHSMNSVCEQFELLMTIIDDHPEWLTTLDTPVLNNNQKLSLLQEINLFDELFTRFLMTLIKNRHIRKIRAIYDEWLVKTRLKQKIAFIQLYTAEDLNQKQLDIIKKDIKPLFPDLEIEFNVHIDPSLIKGVRLYYQGESIERSARRELENMASSI